MSVKLPTLAEMNAAPRACQKGPSRLQVKTAQRKDEAKLEQVWKAAVWKRDCDKCRWCQRKVVRSLELKPERGECHHILSRAVQAVRWDRRNGILLCSTHHELLTGKVSEKYVVVSTSSFILDGISYFNGDQPMTFKRVA